VISLEGAVQPEEEAMLADSVGLALLVVLDTLGPAERLAFVLHDVFGLPFEDIARMVGRSTDAARQLASRARRRIKGAEIAAHCVPERFDVTRGERMDGTLHLRVEGAWALALQHLEPQLIERINGSLGYKAVGRIRLHQGPLPKRPEAPKPAPEPVPVEPHAHAALAAKVARIEDAALRQAVERLGLALLAAESAATMRPDRADDP